MRHYTDRTYSDKRFRSKAVILEEYDNLTEFSKTIWERKPNETFKSRAHDLASQDRDRMSFTKTRSYEEAEELLAYGYKEGYESIKEEFDKIKIDPRELTNRMRYMDSLEGFSPIVPNVLLNLPKSMINSYRKQEKSRVIEIIYGVDSSAGVDSESIISAGRCMLAIVKRLELCNYRVGLSIGFTSNTDSKSNGQITLANIRIKDWKQPLNLLKIAYPIMHPSMLRRHNFRWLETLEDLKDGSYRGGYGHPFEHDFGDWDEDSKDTTKFDGLRNALKEVGMISSDKTFYTSRGEINALRYDEKEVMRKMGITKDE